MSKYLVQKVPYHNVDAATEALNKVSDDGYDIIYVTETSNKLIVIFQKRQRGRPKKTG